MGFRPSLDLYYIKIFLAQMKSFFSPSAHEVVDPSVDPFLKYMCAIRATSEVLSIKLELALLLPKDERKWPSFFFTSAKVFSAGLSSTGAGPGGATWEGSVISPLE